MRSVLFLLLTLLVVTACSTTNQFKQTPANDDLQEREYVAMTDSLKNLIINQLYEKKELIDDLKGALVDDADLEALARKLVKLNDGFRQSDTEIEALINLQMTKAKQIKDRDRRYLEKSKLDEINLIFIESKIIRTELSIELLKMIVHAKEARRRIRES